jgi:chromatin remodeling complex protein RSC6
MKPVLPSERLAKIVGTEPPPRTEVTKKFAAHIKKYHLQNPNNQRETWPTKSCSQSLAVENWTCSND